MAKRIETFADLIAPVGEDAFFAEYHDRKPLHIEASSPDKLDDVMTWETLSRLLNMTAIWSPRSLGLFLDSAPVAPEQYCRTAIDRNGQDGLQPDAEKVKSWLRRGASIVANDIDTLTPGLISAANALERRFRGKVQSNLYCSWNRHQAFPTHFDTHEVFALHVAGEKVWRIFSGRIDQPIAHPAFRDLDESYHEAHRGEVVEEIALRPGDVLYIPRGQYHDALASSDGCIHLSFGITHAIGFDVMGLLFEQAMGDPEFRRLPPLPEAGPGARRAWVERLLARLAEHGRSEEFLAALEKMHAQFLYPRGGFDLPGDALAEAPSDRFGVTAKSLRIVRRNGRAVLESAKGRVPIPDGAVEPVSWIVETREFSGGEFAAAFPQLESADRAKLIDDLAAMKLIAPV